MAFSDNVKEFFNFKKDVDEFKSKLRKVLDDMREVVEENKSLHEKIILLQESNRELKHKIQEYEDSRK